MSYFTQEELACRHCGAYYFSLTFLDKLNAIRAACGFPLPVTSGYRCPEHPDEAHQTVPGAHTRGLAVDVSVSHDRAFWLVLKAMEHGIQRIGISQKGATRFVHLDEDLTLPAPRIWTY